MRAALLSAAGLFLAVHLLTLPPTFDDLDGLNFALGVRHFDVAGHQPHPPGYPLFVALGKMSTAAVRAVHVASPEVRGLAIWSALAGAAVIPLLALLWIAVDGRLRVALLATAIAATAPLFWFTALRPLSDMTGLAASVAALAALARAWPGAGQPERDRGRAVVVGAAIAGLAIGIRSQTAVLSGPLLAACVLLPWSRLTLRARGAAAAAFAAGVAAWGVPLLVASGGPAAYLNALGTQAGEDFSGVVMLWTHPTPRVALAALLDTFVLPWDAPLLAGVVLTLAAAGLVSLAAARRRTLLLVAVMFGPYLVFHLLFQESFTVRYALPLVLPVAFGAAVLIDAAPPLAGVALAVCVAAAGLALAVPAGVAYGRTPSPVFQALETMRREPAPLLAMHRRVYTESRRARAWMPPPIEQTLMAPRDLEWLQATAAIRATGRGLWFLADPRRTDLALIDPLGRRVERERWPFNRRTYVGGARPDEIDLHRIEHPGWLLEEGWALTPETAGIAAREGWRPDLRPSVGWIRHRPGAATLMLGGRHLGAAADGPARVEAAIDGRPVLTFDTGPGFFLRFADLPAGELEGPAGYARLTVRVTGTGSGPAPHVVLEQFDLQDGSTPVSGFGEGWHEAEYNPVTGRSWRWMSERAVVLVRGGTGDVRLAFTGENPRRYFGAAPRVTVSVGGTPLLELHPDRDFSATVDVPRQALDAAGGRIELTSSEMFVPGGPGGAGDQRHLALRITSLSVAPARP